MRKVLVLFCVLLAAVSCQSDKVTRLRPLEFSRHFAPKPPPTAAATTTTNQTDATAAATAAAIAEASRPRLVVPGMVLTVTVEEDRSLNRQYIVPMTGQVEFAGTGRINVLGLTSDEVAKKIRDPLERDFFQKATVGVTIESAAAAAAVGGGVTNPSMTGGSSGTTAGGVVYVLGSVNRPGPLMLPGTEVFTVTKVIIAAGGLGNFAKGTAVRLIRYDEKGRKFETTVNVAGIMKEGTFEDDIPVQNGDWLIVPEKLFSF